MALVRRHELARERLDSVAGALHVGVEACDFRGRAHRDESEFSAAPRCVRRARRPPRLHTSTKNTARHACAVNCVRREPALLRHPPR